MKLEARDIYFTYEYSERQILYGTNLCLESGEKVALLGANGCGKTTLLKILCGLLAPSKGHIILDDKIMKPIPGFNFLVGYVPESPTEMFFESTVEREIAFILKKKKDSNINEKVDKIINQFSLTELRDKSPFEISNGEKRRLSIAAIIAGEQPFVLMDEPISGLDSNGLMAVEDWIVNSDKGIIASTHRTDFARKFDRVLLMNGGHIISDNLDLSRKSELITKSKVMMLWREEN